MCGIAGLIRFDGEKPERAAVERMMARMEARGPDARGLTEAGNGLFGHRRLKIIDLSERGAQPMLREDLGLTGVFNGCIYNFRELRGELEAAGYRFYSESDTEVVLAAYHAWGDSCVERFNGMFAFVLHDRERNGYFAARDRLGIKPFYYHETPGAFAFASSLPALLAGGVDDTRLDPAALHRYLSFHSVVPAPNTVLRAIRKLPPATRMRIDAEGRRHEEIYWTPSFRRDPDDGAGFDELREQVHDTLMKAVKRRLVADVPVGVLLSGGLDSSLVVGLLAEAGQTGLNTFSIGFESAGGEEGNEFRYSDVIAAEFDTRHHKLQIDSGQLVEHLPDCFAAMSEPMVSHDNIGFYLLSREVAKHVKVVQSGQGADEVFGGYFWYPPMMDSATPLEDYAELFCDRDHTEMCEVLMDGYLGEDHSRSYLTQHFEAADAEHPVDKALHIDTTVMLIDDPVKRVDNMTMRWGLEARVPFLDHELVELAARIPPEMKVGNGGKHILKEAARSVIPAAVIDRPKGYFPVPELKYLSGRSLAFVRDALNSEACRNRGLFRGEYVKRMLDEPGKHITPLQGSKLWQLASLEIWLQTHGL
ncbi:N-acetylglutaminylglutamine amidotransferase [Elongatibacter sediminis]|uniref:asparagine synthase (glutamine-hydrolyzing) n=1 Tax=Elongatibacter sediminis TaxID=3119006 RepID=A0AAW9R618_9GAMM